jgi:putative endonuclease
MDENFATYILENEKGERYTGSTNDLAQRLQMHNDIAPEKARFHRTTYNKGPWKVVFVRYFSTRKEATDFERFLKTGAGRDWIHKK